MSLKTTPLPGLTGLLPNSARLLVSDPLPPFGGRRPYKGDIKARRTKDANLPLVRGRAAEGGRGSLISHTSRWATLNKDVAFAATSLSLLSSPQRNFGQVWCNGGQYERSMAEGCSKSGTTG